MSSVQSSSYLDSQVSPIWQNKDLDPTSTSIVYVNKAFNLENPEARLSQLSTRSVAIEQETRCMITIHGQPSKGELIWIKIKGESAEARKKAYNLINEATNYNCFQIILPTLSEEKVLDTRLSSPSPPSSPTNLTTQSKSTAQHEIVKQQNIKSKPVSSSLNPAASPFTIGKRKSTLTRSSTENIISSMQAVESTAPFSVLLPTSQLKENLSKKCMQPIIEGDDCDDESGKPKRKHQYSIDFLLLRADVPSSKQLPSNWKELNEKYPLVCFCGKVLSYFNPYKYHEHWEKTVHTNYELHRAAKPSQEKKYAQKAHTDDYLNLKTTLPNSYMFNKAPRHVDASYKFNAGLKQATPFESRQNQMFYQPDANMTKRKPIKSNSTHFNGSNTSITKIYE